MKTLGFMALALLVLLAELASTLQRWVGTDDFRQRMAGEVSAALGVPVLMGDVGIDVWPVPALALKDLTIQSRPSLALGRVEVRPQWQALLQCRLVVTADRQTSDAAAARDGCGSARATEEGASGAGKS